MVKTIFSVCFYCENIMEKMSILTIYLGLLCISFSVGKYYIPPTQGLDLTLKIHEDLPNHLCGRALSTLESLLLSTSYLLQEETSIFISSIHIVLPASLLNTPCTANLRFKQVTKKNSRHSPDRQRSSFWICSFLHPAWRVWRERTPCRPSS